MIIASVGSALPQHYYDQATISAYLQRVWQAQPSIAARVRALHASVQVQGRHLALPLEAYRGLDTFGRCNSAWIGAAVELGERALAGALAQAGLRPRDIDVIFFSTATGLASPSIDARLMNRMPFRSDSSGCRCSGSVASRGLRRCRALPTTRSPTPARQRSC
jgi:alkylresorcinol/alkylpyrone synthase